MDFLSTIATSFDFFQKLITSQICFIFHGSTLASLNSFQWNLFYFEILV